MFAFIKHVTLGVFSQQSKSDQDRRSWRIDLKGPSQSCAWGWKGVCCAIYNRPHLRPLSQPGCGDHGYGDRLQEDPQPPASMNGVPEEQLARARGLLYCHRSPNIVVVTLDLYREEISCL